MHGAPELLGYLAELTAALRRSPDVELGISPRGGLSLLETARAWALVEGRSYAIPDDFKQMLAPAWAHRLVLTPESELEGRSARQILETVARTVPVPR